MKSNKTRRCKSCGGLMDEGQRDGALFCSDKCRVRHYRSQKEQQADKPDKLHTTPLNGTPPVVKKNLPPQAPPLSGVLDNEAGKTIPDIHEWETVEVENPELIQLLTERKQLQSQLQRNQIEQTKIVNQLKEEGWDVRKLLPWFGAGIGAVAGLYVVSHKTADKKKKDKASAWENTGTVAGLTLLGLFILSMLRPDEEEEKARKLARRNELVKESLRLDEERKNIQVYDARLQSKQKAIPEWIPQRQLTKESKRQQSLKDSFFKAEKVVATLKTNATEENLNIETKTSSGFELAGDELLSSQQPRILEPQQPILTFDGKPRIINSMELGKMKFKRFNFQGRWLEFFGQPAIHFQCVIYGLPGSGKSTFAAQFANYLSRSFGKVVYIAGEEGISATLQDKVNLTGAKNPNLDFADVSHWQQLMDVVPPNTYNFMVLDSLHQLGIDEEVLRRLREQYPNCAFISINQSTKDGKMRGSNVIIHDADISIEVRDGVAVCRKNRFQVTGREFQVLPKPSKTKSDFKEPDNII